MTDNGFSDPQQLLQALKSDAAEESTRARTALRRRFGTLIEHMINRCAEQGTSERDRRKWHERTLIWQELRLRSTPASRVGGDWKSFHVTEVAALAFLLTNVFNAAHDIAPTRTPPLPILPRYPGLHLEAFLHPVDDVGGDCYRVNYEEDGSLWVLVADVTGHGRGAYLIAEALPCLWDRSQLRRARASGRSPAQILKEMDDELRAVLPLGVFVETLAARFKGEVLTVGSASLCPVIQRCPDAKGLRLHLVGGSWLALPVEPSFGEASWPVETGHSWTLASDGLFDQPTEKEGTVRIRDLLLQHTLSTEREVHAVLVETVRTYAGACGRQHDDVTIVTLTRLIS